MSDEAGSIDQTMSDTLASIEAGGGDGASAPAASPSQTPAGDPRQATAPIGQQPQAPTEPWRTMPKSWRREMDPYWRSMPQEAMRYAHEREQQVEQGMSRYRQQLDQWNNTLKPYGQYLSQYNLNPQQIVSSLLPAHIILKYGNAQQKAAVVQLLDRDYGLGQYFQNGQVQQQPSGQDLSPFTNRIAAVEAQLQQRAFNDASSEVESFLADQNNEFAADAAPRMLELLENGRASTLREAYEVATRTDPAIFERIIAKRIEAAARPQRTPPANLRSSPVRAPSNPAATRGTIEDTMRETLHSIHNR